MDWTQTYPGLHSMVPAIRAFVRSMLADSPRRDDAESVATELATNSLRHTPSGNGGEVAVTVTTGTTKDGTDWARIEVSDAGTGAWTATAASEWDEYGRGLAIVERLADKFGHDVADDGQTMWAEVTWTTDE